MPWPSQPVRAMLCPVFLRELRDPVTRLRGAGKAVAALLARMGIYTIADLFLHFPRDWDDRSSWIGFA